jgi:uncharacterized protein with PIN domain
MREASEEARKAEFLRRAGAAYERTLKEDQEQMITFTQMEERVIEVGTKLEQWLLEECLQETRRHAAEAVCCPKCRKPVPRPREEEEARKILGRCGPVEFKRMRYVCPSCRKVFSPAGYSVATGR